jgi:hypothetical protein
MKQSAVSFLLIFIIFLGQALSQDKLAPPPTRIILPSDTTKAEPDDQQKIQAEKPQLELPDVVVFGQDREVRAAGGKGALTPESPTLLTPESPYEEVSIWFDKEASKPEMEGSLGAMDQMYWASIQGGSYSTFMLDGGYWSKLKLQGGLDNPGDYRLRGWLDRSSGQFNNSKYAQGGFSGRLSYQLSPRTTGTARAEFSLFKRGMPATNLAQRDFIRSGSTGNLNTELQFDIDNLSNAKVSLEIGRTGVQSDTSSKRLDQTSDFWFDFNSSYSKKISSWHLTASGHYIRESVDLLQDSTTILNSISELSVQVLGNLSQSVIAVAGLAYQSGAADSFAAVTQVSPFARINFIPNSVLGLTGIVYTGLELKSFTQYWMENPYLSHNLPLVADRARFAMRLESDLALGPKLRMKGGISRSWMDRLHYWERNSTTQLIDLHQIQDVELTEIQLGFVADLNARTRLQVSFISYSDKIAKADSLPEFDRIPYRPDFRIPVRISMQLPSDMYLGVEAEINGIRHSSLVSAGRLPAYGRVQATLTKDFNKMISGFLSVRNLLDSKYVVWENYPETGFNLLLGLRGKF